MPDRRLSQHGMDIVFKLEAEQLGDREHLCVTYPRQAMARVSPGLHRLLNHPVDAYNLLGGQRSSPVHCCLATSVNPDQAMIAN